MVELAVWTHAEFERFYPYLDEIDDLYVIVNNVKKLRGKEKEEYGLQVL